MSGIAGIIFPDAFQTGQLINPMLHVLSRGNPSKQDSFSFKTIEIGCVGQTIASNENKTLLVGLDGQLNNQEELSKKLQFHTEDATDAKLILYAFEKWDTHFLEHLDGEFAFFLFDTRKMRLILARDRIGRKPLFWYHDHGYFIFGSQLKAILSTGIIPQTPALDAISSYLYFGYIPQDMTPLQGINKLLPAYYLQINQDLSKSIEAYWSYSSYFEKSRPLKKELIVKKLRDLITESAKKEVPKDTSVGCFVSGGLGSAAIAYFVSQLTTNATSYSVGFQSQNEDDLQAAKSVTQDLGMPHEIETVHPRECIENLVKIVWELDEPLADTNVLATWKLAETAAKHSKIVFSGTGSDELLAGQCRHTTSEQPESFYTKLKQKYQPALLKALVPIFKMLFKPAVYAILKKARTNPWQLDYLRRNALFNEKILSKAAPKLANLFDPEAFLHKFHHLDRIHSTFGSNLYFDIKTRLPDCFILQYERLTEAYNLKWHSPFLDRPIVEYLASVEAQESGQYLKAMLPESLLSRPKRSPKDFLRDWSEEPEIKKLFDLLPNGRLTECGLISGKWIREQLVDAESRKRAFPYLWAILSLEIWYRLFISGPIHATPPHIDAISLLKEI